MMQRHRVAITGLGMVSALGSDVDSCWRRLVAGDNGIRTITYFDASQYGCKVAAEAHVAVLPAPVSIRVPDENCRRGTQLFVRAARGSLGSCRG